MSTANRVGIILLAAGGSRRLGQPKQLVEWHGKTLLRHAAETALAAGLGPLVVVLGAERERCTEALQGLQLTCTHHACWEQGMAGSVRQGLDALLAAAPEIDAAILMLCDQPLLRAEVLLDLVAQHRSSGSPMVASDYGGALGAPALFSRTVFAALWELQGDQGARRLWQAFPEQVSSVPFPGGKDDIDTMEDVERLRRQCPS